MISATPQENRSAYGADKIAPRTTVVDPKADRAKDLGGCNFNPLAPNRLWVADIYVHTLADWVYAFVIDAYARRILGWMVSNRTTTPRR